MNLFIPAALDWPERGLAFDLDTALPDRGEATLRVRHAPRRRQAIALRLPGWAKDPTLRLNGAPVVPTIRDGYAVIERQWRAGDMLALTLPMALAAEPTPDDPALVAFTYGPQVLAADLGRADAPFAGAAPALLRGGDATDALRPGGGPGSFVATDALGAPLTLRPFAAQYDRRTAVYFPTFTATAWAGARDGYLTAQRDAQALARRTVDTLFMGEMQPERDHAVDAGNTEVVNWAGRSARRLRQGDTLRLALARRPGAAVLRLLVWGQDVGREIAVTVDGAAVGTLAHRGPASDRYVALDLPLPAATTTRAGVALTAAKGEAVIYEARMLAGEE